MKFTKSWAAAAATVALMGTAQAALVLQANGLEVLDTNTNLIWLKDWNKNNRHDWITQKAWAETTLDGFAGSNDWVLPSISQYVGLFTAYGNLTSVSQFLNVQSSYYWSGTEYAPLTAYAWIFGSAGGNQAADVKTDALYAVAVRPGDVAASVPEPQTLALALLALGATVVARRRRPG